MIKLNSNHIDAIRFSEDLSSAVARNLDDPTLASKASADLSDAERDALHDACLDVLMNDAPTVESWLGETGRNDPFPISVAGIPGAYFVSALEYDAEGAFTSLDEALDWVDYQFSEAIQGFVAYRDALIASPPPDDKQLYFVTDDAMITSGDNVDEAANLWARYLAWGRVYQCLRLISQDGRTFHYQFRIKSRRPAGQSEDRDVYFSMTRQGTH